MAVYCVADKFIEILMTKGERGYKRFVELLEFRCPHVFREMTGVEPRDPPAGKTRQTFKQPNNV